MKRFPLVILAASAIAFVGAGCARQTAVKAPAGGTRYGVSLSPKSFQGEDFSDFFVKAAQAGDIVSWAGDWDELSSDTGAPVVVTGLSKSKGYAPVILAQFFTQSTGKLLRPLDAATRERYLKGAEAFAKTYKPPYVGLGIEVNMLAEKSPKDFDAFVLLFDEAATAIKAASPDTKVFTTFELERLRGLRGGLFGGKNDEKTAQWELINRFPKADLVAFSSYPDLIYKDPKEIPDSYYADIAAHVQKPIVFTELGWHAAASPKGWEGSEEEQAAFVKRFFDLTRTLKPEFAIWSFLYDQVTIEPFRSMGFFSRDGKERSAFAAWTAGVK